jgi:hypothetical protein
MKKCLICNDTGETRMGSECACELPAVMKFWVPKRLRPPTQPVPEHYATKSGAVTPWDLQRGMESMGHPFVDARRTDVIEYAFRRKGGRADWIADLRKAAHCALEAAALLEEEGTA